MSNNLVWEQLGMGADRLLHDQGRGKRIGVLLQ